MTGRDRQFRSERHHDKTKRLGNVHCDRIEAGLPVPDSEAKLSCQIRIIHC